MKNLYQAIFFAANGFGPYPCHFCGEEVSMERVVVHHIDEDHTNDDSTNLAASHVGCHTRHHNTGRKRPDITTMNRTRKRTAQERANIRKAALTPEGRRQKSAAGKKGAASRWGR